MVLFDFVKRDARTMACALPWRFEINNIQNHFGRIDMIRKIIGILLCCALLFGVVSIGVFATVTVEEMPIPSSDDTEVSNINSDRIDDYEKGTINYSIDDYGLLTISGSGPMSNGGYQFCENKSIKTIVIKQGVTSIGNGAFRGCSGLTSVTIPDSVTSIGDGAFYDCAALTSVIIPGSVTNISGSAFENCQPIIYGDVDSYAQQYANEKDFVFLKNTLCSLCHDWDEGKVTANATDYSKGTKVYTCKVCNKTKTEYIFKDEYLIASGEAEDSKWYLDKNGTLTITGKGNMIPESFCIGDFNNPGEWYDFANNIKALIISGDYEFLDYHVPSNCKNLQTVEISGIKRINGFAFSNNLKTVKIGCGVYLICQESFSRCGNLEIVDFGNEIKKIDGSAFYCCESLQSIRIDSNNVNIGGRSFASCRSLKSVQFSSRNVKILGGAFYYCGNLQSVQFASGDVIISNEVFAYCGNEAAPTVITIPIGKTVVGEDAFNRSNVVVHFLGDVPKFEGELDSSDSGTVICYYPCGNETWNTRLPRTAEWRVEHPYGAWTNLNDNQHQRVCANDASHTETADHEWNNGEVTKVPTTKAEGEKTYTCIVCGATKNEPVPKLNPPEESYVPGDVDGNGQILANDARLALRASAKLEELDKKQLLAADVDGDKRVLANDARQILRYSAKLQRGFEKAVPGTVPTTTLPVTTPMIERTTKALPAWVMTNFAAEVFQYINEYRAQYGYMAYTLDAKLCTLASIRCKELVTNFSDMRPDGTDFSTVFGEYGIIYNKCGESILRDNDMDARGAVVELSKNDADNQKIFAPMSDFDRIGVAVLQNGSNYYLVILYSGS